MGTINFNSILSDLIEQAKQIATSTFKDYKKEAAADAENLILEIKSKLEKWTIELSNGNISKDDFEFQVLSQKELIEMKALKQAGIALIKIDELKSKLFDSLVDTIIGKIL
jgi:hypothetical protein